MPYSMTGYGRFVEKNELYSVTIELRSVNHRFLDFSFRLPKKYLWLEESCSKVLKSFFRRGKIDAFLQINSHIEEAGQRIGLDRALLEQYISNLKAVKKEYKITGRIKLKDLLQIPDLFVFSEPDEDEEAVKEFVLATMEKAAENLLTMRKNEGDIISQDLSARIEKLKGLMAEVEAVSHELPALYKEKLSTRLQELTSETIIDENRLAAEILLYVDRSAITEEIVRFQSHLEQFAQTLQVSEPIGRKLDFITQELHRETNTIAAKSGELSISHNVVEIKAEIEKIREQVQNLE